MAWKIRRSCPPDYLEEQTEIIPATFTVGAAPIVVNGVQFEAEAVVHTDGMSARTWLDLRAAAGTDAVTEVLDGD